MKTLLLFLAPVFIASAQPGALVKEDFSANNYFWSLTEEQSLNDGVLLINSPEDGDQAFISAFIDPVKDFTITADLIQKSGLTDGGYGIVWGASDINYNLFMVTSSQEYVVYSGDPAQIKKWKTSPAIKPLGETNQLRVEHTSGKLSFYINNTKVEEQKEFLHYGSWTGMLIFSQMQLAVDNFNINQTQVIALPEQVKNFAAKENLGPGVNSADDDIGPIISADGKTLYFARQNVKENIGGVYDDEDIWVSQYEKEVWSRAKNMGRGINTGLADNLIAVSADNNSMIFEKDNAIAVRHRTATGWSDFEKIDLTFKNESDYFVATFAADGKAIIFSAKLKQNIYYDSKREEVDLYVSLKDKNNKWSAPINLGSSINTNGDDTSPFLSPDGKTLYFASNGRPGYGYQDIFFTKRVGDSWTDWSTPINLGPNINTAGFDAYYTVPASGDYAYFVSYDKGFGKGDIFRIKLHEDIKPNPVILVKGSVLNSKDNTPLAAVIHFENLATGVEIGEARSDPKTGNYQIVLPYGVNYGVRANVSGFYSIHENIELKENSKYSEVSKDLLMVPIAIGETVKLNNVFFEAGLPTLKSESYPELDRLVKVLIDNPGIYIELEGHTDAKGNADALMKLSQERVDAVKAYLVKNNIPAERITGTGYGASKPVAPSDTEENSRLNRRVSLKIVKK
jgi:outer membrane protein OmpA-like peptidoglycan-associated protein